LPEKLAVTSREVWDVIAYYAKAGAPKVKQVAKRLLAGKS
jgi:hypothetical protein